MQQIISVFLGANSPSGFFSLYPQLLSARFDDLLILKGGPGCGKSTFMRTLAQDLSTAAPQQIHVPCSGDPESLDAVIFPSLCVGAVDGTAPHALEPTYSVANERIVDLTRFYEVEKVKKHRAEIVLLTDTYRARYQEAYRILAECGEIKRQRRSIACADMDDDKWMHRMQGILSRELNGRGEGRESRVFLDGLTYQGNVCHFDTIGALCPRVYELQDSCGLARPFLAAARERALSCGKTVLSCMDADDPQKLKHLLIPDCGLAFVSSDRCAAFPKKPYRRLRLDAMAEKHLTGTEKAKLHFLWRMEQMLREEARSCLKDAKLAHDALERVYHPYVNFNAVTALAHEEAQRIRKMAE